MKIRHLPLVLTAAVAASACATGDWARIQADFPSVQANCGLPGTIIERSRSDPRLIHLVFRHRSNMALQAREDGRVACAQHWAEEQGFRLTTEPVRGAID
jgi:hypothetical protein